eukprot:258694-Pyramimonas_sp.AAC.2
MFIVKPLIRPLTTGEFDSPLHVSRMPKNLMSFDRAARVHLSKAGYGPSEALNVHLVALSVHPIALNIHHVVLSSP